MELGPSDPGETFADPNVGERVAAALAARGIGAVDTLVAVGRASIELRLLQLPPLQTTQFSYLLESTESLTTLLFRLTWGYGLSMVPG